MSERETAVIVAAISAHTQCIHLSCWLHCSGLGDPCSGTRTLVFSNNDLWTGEIEEHNSGMFNFNTLLD